MIGLRYSLLATACALGLAACDVSVRDQPSAANQDSGVVTQSAPAPSSSESTASIPPSSDTSTTTAQAPLGADSSSAPAIGGTQGDTAAVSPAAPVPETSAMGAQPAPAMPAAGDGSAAPTELSQFLEQSQQAAAAKKAEPAKAEAKTDSASKKAAKS
jgi:hypothetical protein